MVVYGYGSKQLEAFGERQGTLALSRWKNRKSQRVLTRTWWMKKIEVLLSVHTRYASRDTCHLFVFYLQFTLFLWLPHET